MTHADDDSHIMPSFMEICKAEVSDQTGVWYSPVKKTSFKSRLDKFWSLHDFVYDYRAQLLFSRITRN